MPWRQRRWHGRAGAGKINNRRCCEAAQARDMERPAPGVYPGAGLYVALGSSRREKHFPVRAILCDLCAAELRDYGSIDFCGGEHVADAEFFVLAVHAAVKARHGRAKGDAALDMVDIGPAAH